MEEVSLRLPEVNLSFCVLDPSPSDFFTNFPLPPFSSVSSNLPPFNSSQSAGTHAQATPILNLKAAWGTSPVAQWLRICLPMQGTRVRALVWEDPTYHRATKPMHHNY